ncbi:MAG TPA: VTT domain-containing protein [Vicinamibacterales bacterium]|jgi:uncharacterized membrane protein YdjX (TVP38/TMEM64 family)|nr:VTT domain-containing protein [Vicinamibacterales bacterium]HVZ21320.1 VTT domain-containing protein [Vicinamibacterales bacterium]
MSSRLTSPGRRVFAIVWLVAASAAVYAYVAHRDWLREMLGRAVDRPTDAAVAVLVLLGAVRAFTFVPATMLVLAALPFVAPGPLLAATLAGIAASSSIIYGGARFLGMGRHFEARHGRALGGLRARLERYELPVVVAWSFAPFAPTDAVCYLCGVMRVRFLTFLIGVVAGEGAVCAIYIYGGDYILRRLHWR